MNPREDDPEFAPHRPTFEDLRADYDDAFADRWTPYERARHRLFVPGMAHVGIGSVGVLGMLALALIALLSYLDDGLNDTEDVIELVAVEVLIGLGVALFALVIVGGVSMMQMRRRWLCLFAAYVVTGLSISGCYAILFYPFGIWGLIVLYRPDVREQFGRPAPPREPDDDLTE